MEEKVYCLIRKQHVAALPEEKIRQRLISLMIEALGFPFPYLAIEKNLKQMPHLQLTSQKIPNRRADLICYSKDIHPVHSLYPLLLVECKAVPLKDAVIQQVVSYNQFLKAYFIAVANEKEVKTGWFDHQKKRYVFVEGMPCYQDLLKSVVSAHNP